MTFDPKISILIPTYLRANALRKKINELKKLSLNYNLEPVFVLESEDKESYNLIENSGLNKYKICYCRQGNSSKNKTKTFYFFFILKRKN